MGPRHLQAQIHSDYTTGSANWSNYRSQIKSLYDASISKVDFNNHLIREYNRKINTLNQSADLYISPFDGGFRFVGDFIFPLLTTITYIDSSVETFDITTIPDNWKESTSITSVVIGSSVTSIGDGAFLDCSSLTSVTIPNSVTHIGKFAFANCSSLTSVTIPNSVTSIGFLAFAYCTSLTSVIIPNSVTSIGKDAFKNCIGLTSITIPNSVTSIGQSAFSSCISLTSITIPNSVTSIGESALQSCASLNTLNCYVARSVIDVSTTLVGTASPFTIYARASDSTWTAGTDTIGGKNVTVVKNL